MRGEDALLEVDAVDPVRRETVVPSACQNLADPIEVPMALHASQRDVSFPVASLRGEAGRFQGGLERTRYPCERLRAFHSGPDGAPPRKGWEPGRPASHKFER